VLSKEDYKKCKLSPKKLAILKLNGYEIHKDNTYPQYSLYHNSRRIARFREGDERWDVHLSSDYTEQVIKLRALIGKHNAY
jgi:hypothetical protein